MNYRHAFHAGNFADLVKHAALTELLAELVAKGPPVTVIDTHAGRGLYDLGGVEARKSGEAETGIVRLMRAPDAPPEFSRLKVTVAALNGGGEARTYPGSPWLIAAALRPADRYLGCELRPEEHDALRVALRGRQNVRTLCVDGYAVAAAETPAQGRVLLLIDPPFEKADDYARIVETLARVRRRNPGAQALVWLPLKDLETFDGFLRDLEDAVPRALTVVEARMRPLNNPMKMNGCALVLMGVEGFEARLAAIAGWVAQALGEAGSARTYALGSH